MTIRIENLRFLAIIGVLERERREEQEVVVDLEAEYRYRKGGYLDYALIAEEIVSHIRERRYELLEEALLGIEELLAGRHPELISMSCRITKPHILPNAQVSVSHSARFPRSDRVQS